MRRQGNMPQMKEQVKTPEKELNNMEIRNLLHAEFKTLAIRMLKEVSEDLNSIKKIQPETKDMLIEIKNNLQGNNSRVDKTKNQINDLEHKEENSIQPEQQEEKRIIIIKKRKISRNLWGNFKPTNICIIRVPEGEMMSKKFKTYLKNNERKLP